MKSLLIELFRALNDVSWSSEPLDQFVHDLWIITIFGRKKSLNVIFASMCIIAVSKKEGEMMMMMMSYCIFHVSEENCLFNLFFFSIFYRSKAMSVQKLHRVQPQASISPSHSMQIQLTNPRPVMSTPQGYKRHQTLMTEAQVIFFGDST